MNTEDIEEYKWKSQNETKQQQHDLADKPVELAMLKILNRSANYANQ